MREMKYAPFMFGVVGLLALSLLFFFALNLYDIEISRGVTGFQIIQGGEPAPIEVQPEPEPDLGGGSGSSGGNSFSSDSRRVSSSTPIASFRDVEGFSVRLSSGRINSEDSILVTKPEPEDEIVANGVVVLKSSLNVPRKSTGEIKIDFPKGSSFLRVAGPEEAKVTINTRRFFGDFVEVLNAKETRHEDVITIKDPEPGDYEILFSANTPYISEIEIKKSGQIGLEVKNPSNIDYYGVNIYTEIQTSTKNARFEVLSSGGQKHSTIPYDSNEDGIADVIKFTADLLAGTTKNFVISEVSGSSVLFGSLDEDIFLSPTIPTSISPECENSIITVESSACEFSLKSDNILKNEIEGAVKRTFYRFNDKNCPETFVRSESCSLEKGENVKVVNSDVFNSPLKDSSKISVNAKSVEVVNVQTGKRVAFLAFDAEKRTLDIVF